MLCGDRLLCPGAVLAWSLGWVRLLSARLFALRCLFAWFRRALLRRLCFVSRTVRVCVAFLLRVCAAVLLELTELAKPVEMPRICCNTRASTCPRAQ